MAQKTFSFNSLPHTVDELRLLPEAELKDPFAVAALTLIVFCEYRNNPANCVEMLNFLKGPQPASPFEKQFIRDRLGDGQDYVPYSFLNGATPENNYVPSVPYAVTVSDNPYSYGEENRAVLWIKSSGADSSRQVSLRKKPSTGQWFETEQMLLGGIRIPVAADPWA